MGPRNRGRCGRRCRCTSRPRSPGRRRHTDPPRRSPSPGGRRNYSSHCKRRSCCSGTRMS
jgi:hypothetical protein